MSSAPRPQQESAVLEEPVRLYRLIADAIPDLVWAARADGWADFFNRRFHEYCGLDAQQLEGWGWKQLVHPGDAQRCIAAWERALQTGRRYEIDCRLRRADGEYRWHRATAVPAAGPDGRAGRWFGTCTDIESEVRSAQESEQKYRVLVELSQDGIAVTQDGRFAYVNEATVRLLGAKSAEELIGKPVREVVHESCHAWFDERERLLALGEAQAPADWLLRRLDGGHVWAEASSAPLAYQGRPAVLFVMRDVGARREAEAALRASEARFRVLTALSSDFYWETDAAHRFKDLVYGPRVRLALPLEAQLGRTRWEIPCGSPGEEGWAAHRAMLDARLPFDDFELSRILPGGEERFYSVSGQPVFDQAGGFAGYCGAGRDITQRKQAERALRDSERRFQLFMEQVPAIAWIKDAGFRYTYVNRTYEHLHRQPVAQILGREDFELWPPQVARALREGDEAALRSDGAVQRLDAVPNAQGRTAQWLAVKFPLPDPAGGRGVGGFAIDVTARIEAENQARTYAADVRRLMNRLVAAQESERRRVASDLHDLIGQNLTALGLELETVRGRLSGESLGAAGPRLDAMASLVESTIGAIRGVMAELRPAALEELGLVPALRGYAAEFGARTGMKVSVSVAACTLRLTPEGDLALFRIVQEALTNAAKHSGGGSVRISLAKSAGRIRLAVEDDGHGFAEPLGARRARRGGWGLPAMRERAEAHGWALRVEFPGSGTRIVVELGDGDAD